MKIADDQRLVRVVNRFGRELPIYDDGCGPLWIHRDSIGISCVVRAQSWEDAHAICEDEFFLAGDEEAAKEREDIEALPEGSEERVHLETCWEESFGFRGNSRKEAGGSLSSIYRKDLNGDSLSRLTGKLCAELELTVEVEREAGE